MAPIYWLLIFIVLLVIEIITLGLATIWFCGGAIVAFIAALMGVGLEVQVVLFLVVSIVLLIFTRPFVAKYINRNTIKTNVYSIAGKQARVTRTIDNKQGTGTAVVNGQEWTARTVDDDMIIRPNTMVTIVSVQGVKLIVKTIEEEEA